MNPHQALRREALRLHERYQRELIERFSVCPWAKPSRMAGRTRAHVVTTKTGSAQELLPLLSTWADESSLEVGFVIVPRFDGNADSFSDWAESIVEPHADVFLSAPFYPSVSDSAGSIQFLRQTPDPTVQLVRRSRLEEIRVQDPPHYRDIFEIDMNDLAKEAEKQPVAASVVAHNERMLEREGRAGIQAIFEDIRKDREQTYAKLLPRM
ncbi:MAG: hypothetical protein ACN4G0_03875 [Polyangiales bacterium]